MKEFSHSLFFDLDGTLIDSGGDLADAINRTRADFGLAPKAEPDIVACVGEGMRKLVERAIPEKPELWEAMLARQLANYSAHCLDRTRLYPKARETLQALAAAGARLAVVTNKPAPVTRKILEGLGAWEIFAAVVAGGDCAALKPDAGPVRLAAKRLGTALTADDWMVGDNFTDLAAGRNAGIKRCWCSFGYGKTRGETYEREARAFEEIAGIARDCRPAGFPGAPDR
jgi:phosphoglycolate phosphatase